MRITHTDIERLGKHFTGGLRDYASLTFLRSIPIVPSILLSFGSGMLELPVRVFLVGTLNANMIFKWLRDARYAPGSAQGAVDAPVFLPVEILNPARAEAARPILPSNVLANGLLEIEIAGGYRLRVSGSYDPEALARLIRGLSG